MYKLADEQEPEPVEIIFYKLRLYFATGADVVEAIAFIVVIVLLSVAHHREQKETKVNISYSVPIQLALLLTQCLLYFTSNLI